MSELRTDFKDDVLDVTQNEKRKYRVIHNEDGTISLEDATVYAQKGDNFGANELNEMNRVTNQMLGVNEKLEEINKHPKATLVSEEGTHDLRYNEKQLQVKEGENWKPATVDMVYGNGKKISKIRYGQKTITGEKDSDLTLGEIKYQKAIVYNDLIYAFTTTICYVFDGEKVVETMTLPATINDSSAVHEWEGEIHVFSGTGHYKYDGEYWVTLPTSPYTVYGRVVLHRGELHFIFAKKHYKYDGETWTELSELPVANTSYTHGVCFSRNNLLYSIAYNYLYEYNDADDTWTTLRTLAISYVCANVRNNPYAIMGNKLYIGYNQYTYNSNQTYSKATVACVDLDTWSSSETISNNIDDTYKDYTNSNGTYIVYKDVLYSLGWAQPYIFKAGYWWRIGASLPVTCSQGHYRALDHKGELHVLGLPHMRWYNSTTTYIFTKHIKRVNGEWVEDSPCPVGVSTGGGIIVSCNDGIHVMGNSTASGPLATGTAHYVFDGEVWTQLNNLPTSTANIHAGIEYKGKLHIISWANNKGYLYAYENNQWYTKATWDSSGTSSNSGPCPTAKNGITSALMFVINDKLYMIYQTYLYVYDGQSICERKTVAYKFGNVPYHVHNDKEVFVYGAAGSNASENSTMTSAGRFLYDGDYVNQLTIVAPGTISPYAWWIEDNIMCIGSSGGIVTRYDLTYDINTILEVECE